MPSNLRSRPAVVQFSQGGVGIIESHHDESFLMRWRRDPYLKILYIIGGSGVLELERQSLSFRAKSLCIIPAALRHRLVDSPGRAVSLCGVGLRSPEFHDREIGEQVFREPHVVEAPPEDIPLLFRELLAEERLRGPGCGHMQVAIAWRILILAGRFLRATREGTLPGSRQRVALAAAAMERDFWKGRSLDSVAREAGLSRRRFTQLFREVTSESWHRRLERQRMAHAKHLLATTPISIRAAAFECGYADLGHFYRTFRKWTRATPAEARIRARDHRA